MTPGPTSEAESSSSPVLVHGGVVVGDDGSPYAAEAVRAAAEEAVMRERTLHVVRAWSLTSADRPDDVPFGVVPSLEEFQASTSTVEQRRVHALLPDTPPPDVRVHVMHAPPAKALLRAAADADLLVLGHRNRGGFERLVLGSVAEQVLRRAPCPVLLVGTGT